MAIRRSAPGVPGFGAAELKGQMDSPAVFGNRKIDDPAVYNYPLTKFAARKIPDR